MVDPRRKSQWKIGFEQGFAEGAICALKVLHANGSVDHEYSEIIRSCDVPAYMLEEEGLPLDPKQADTEREGQYG